MPIGITGLGDDCPVSFGSVTCDRLENDATSNVRPWSWQYSWESHNTTSWLAPKETSTLNGSRWWLCFAMNVVAAIVCTSTQNTTRYSFKSWYMNSKHSHHLVRWRTGFPVWLSLCAVISSYSVTVFVGKASFFIHIMVNHLCLMDWWEVDFNYVMRQIPWQAGTTRQNEYNWESFHRTVVRVFHRQSW